MANDPLKLRRDAEGKVNVQFELYPAEAMALAQFCKRSTFEMHRQCSVDEDETYVMLNATAALRAALADAGYRPR